MIRIGDKTFRFIFNRAGNKTAASIFNIGWATSLVRQTKKISGFKNSVFIIQIMINNGRLRVGTLRRVQLIEKAG